MTVTEWTKKNINIDTADVLSHQWRRPCPVSERLAKQKNFRLRTVHRTSVNPNEADFLLSCLPVANRSLTGHGRIPTISSRKAKEQNRTVLPYLAEAYWMRIRDCICGTAAYVDLWLKFMDCVSLSGAHRKFYDLHVTDIHSTSHCGFNYYSM